MPLSEETLQQQLSELHRELEGINNSILIKQSEQLHSSGGGLLLGSLPENDFRLLKSRSTPFLPTVGKEQSGLGASSDESLEKNSTESVDKNLKNNGKKMGITELIDFRNRTKFDNITMDATSLRHSWSPNAFEQIFKSEPRSNCERTPLLRTSASQESLCSESGYPRPTLSSSTPTEGSKRLNRKSGLSKSAIVYAGHKPSFGRDTGFEGKEEGATKSKSQISNDALAKIAVSTSILVFSREP